MKNESLRICEIFLFLLVVILFIGCGKKKPEIKWDYSNKDIIGSDLGQSELNFINLDVYIDATTSMQGFAVNPNNAYNKFLEEIETAANTAWEKTDVKYFKFGTNIKRIERNEFLRAKFPGFYSDRGIFEKTKIDSVIYKTDLSRLSVVVTDLFQTEGDINSIVLQIKERCFSKNIQLAILGVKSYYEGKVFDAKVPSYKFVSKMDDEKTFRPFYAIMFGEPQNILRLFTALKNKPFVKEENFILISKFLVNKFETKLTKTKESKSLSMRKSEKGPNTFEYTLKENARGGKFDLELSYDRMKFTPQFDPSLLELEVFSKRNLNKAKEKIDSSYSRDLRLIGLKHDENKINSALELELENEPGIFSYRVYLQLPAIGGFIIPDWVKEFSSENPSPSKDANKTLNLEKFITNLIQANISISRTKIAKFFITIRHQ